MKDRRKTQVHGTPAWGWRTVGKHVKDGERFDRQLEVLREAREAAETSRLTDVKEHFDKLLLVYKMRPMKQSAWETFVKLADETERLRPLVRRRRDK